MHELKELVFLIHFSFNVQDNQTSTEMLRSWRANCDIQLLIYSSDPKNPDPSEIARVVNYVVGYSCKGGHTHVEERNQLEDLVNA